MIDKLLNRLRGLTILQKLGLLSATAFAPCALVCAMYFSATEDKLDFTRQETLGRDYLSAIWPLIASAGLGLSGEEDPRLAHRLAAFEAASAEHANRFGVGAEALALAASLRAGAEGHANEHETLDAGLALIRTVADRSNLVLDPELASYYAMDLVVFRLPELVAAAESFRDLTASEEARQGSEFLLAVGELAPTLNAARDSLGRYRSYVADTGASPHLADAGRQMQFAIEDLEASANDLISPEQGHAAETAAVAAFRALVLSDTLWRYADEELGRLLEQRLDKQNADLALTAMILLLSMLATVSCMVFLAHSLVSPQRRLVDVMQTLVSGDLKVVVPFRLASAEIGEVARAVEVFRCAMIERQMLEEDLADERDRLELRVEERTQELAAAKGQAEVAFEAMSEALRAANAGMWRYDWETETFWASEVHRGITGHDQSALRMMHPDDVPKVLAARTVADSGKNGRDLEFRIIRPDGETRWINASWNWLTKDVLVGLNVDITARKQHELAVGAAHGRAEEARRLLNQALETVRAGIWGFEKGGEGLWCSPEFTTQFQTPMNPSHIDGDGIWTAVHPGDRLQVARWQRRALAGEDGNAVDFRIQSQDGGVRWVSSSWRWVSNERLVGLLVDISDRKAQEEETVRARLQAEYASERTEEARRTLAQALATASAGVWGYNPNSHAVWSSPEVEALFGAPIAPEELIGGIWRLFHPDDHESVRAALGQYAAVDAGFDFDARIIHGVTGAPGWVSLSWRRQADGSLLGLVMDITARKEAALELARAREAAEAANAAKSAFLATMSHEIRTPLNGILGMTTGLERTALDTKQTMMLGVIRDAGELLLSVLNDVLDVSKIEAGGMRFENAPLDVSAALQSAVSLFQETARDKGVRLDLEVAPEATGSIMGDAMRIRQIVQNLVSNAVKFTERGSVTISARTETSAGGAETLVLSVADTGIGMTPAQAARVFERFSQAEAGIARRFGGTGLGLTICRDLASLMGGDISVESTLNEGSRFTLRLPMERAKTQMTASDAADMNFGDEAVSLRLLLVDDNAMNRLVMKTLFDQMDLPTAFAEDGAQAVAMAMAQGFDAIFMDVHMPVMDGLAATRAIRNGGGRNATTPIIALSADSTPDQIARCLEAGMNAHVAKPIRPEALFAALSQALDQEAVEDEAALPPLAQAH